MTVNVGDVVVAEPMPWDVFLLTMIGVNGFLAAVSLAGFVTFQVTKGLYWFLKEFFNLDPVERLRILINGFVPLVLSMLCCTLATEGGYAQWTPNLAFGAFQVGLVVGFGPYLGISVGKAAVRGTRQIVERAKSGRADQADQANQVGKESQEG
ncbi:MAG TPA: hypothetical protein VF914_05525 [Chloroflexia bacterium]|jgi:hypothetical protein